LAIPLFSLQVTGTDCSSFARIPIAAPIHVQRAPRAPLGPLTSTGSAPVSVIS
jgi:hypothetical protein